MDRTLELKDQLVRIVGVAEASAPFATFPVMFSRFRRGKLSHYELSRVLGLDRFETDAYLKRHNVFEGSLTLEDLEADLNSLRDLFSQKR